MEAAVTGITPCDVSQFPGKLQAGFELFQEHVAFSLVSVSAGSELLNIW